MCPKCRNFTNAPVGQRHRRCSYCGTIIDITKANRALFDSPEQAAAAVKEFNAARGGDEFKEAVERSHERVRALMPKETVKVEDIESEEEDTPMLGKRKRLMTILGREAQGKLCSLDKLEELCESDGLKWEWVEKTLEGLSNSGVLIFPRPWAVQLVDIEEDESSSESAKRDISSEIIALLKNRGGVLEINEIVHHFGKLGISEASVDSSLERLIHGGDIFQPSVRLVKLV